MASDAKLGETPRPEDGRDAVHVAIIPMIALTELHPGQHLANGIVDPYRVGTVAKGERYWLLLYPGTITNLRHVWSHPSFGDEK